MGAIVKHNFPNLINNFFDDWNTPTEKDNKHHPEVQIEKSDKAYRVLVQLPCAVKDKLKVAVEDNYLKITGEYAEIVKKDYELVRRDFRHYDSFERWLKIDERKFDLEAVDAELKDGILAVELPLRAEEQRKQVEVKVK